MNKLLISFALGAAVIAGAPAFARAAPAGPPKEASIPFADHGGIRDFRVQDDDTLYIQAAGGKWYRADLFSSCIGLKFHETLGFETSPGGSFDRWSAVRTRGQRCPVKSLVQADPPAKAGKAAARG